MNAVVKDINSLIALFDREVTTLEQILKDSPASSLVRIVLLKKYKELNHPEYEKLREESALFVPNLPWYLYILSTFGNANGNDETMQTAPEEVVVPDEPIKILPEIMEGTVAAELVSPPDNGKFEPGPGSLNELNTIETPKEETENIEVNSGMPEVNLPAEAHEELTDPGARVTEDGTFTYMPAEEPEKSEADSEDNFSAAADENGLGEPEQESHGRVGQESLNISTKAGHVEDPVIPEQGQGMSPESSPSDDAAAKSTPETIAETELPTSAIDDEAETKAEEGRTHKEEIEFEPLHTIDYFASQGIKLREEDLRDDRLSQQVKSFTGWLKSMKKLHPGRLPEQNEVIEKIIQNAAESSNIEKDVLTEAMAEVLVKQNKKDKAMEMYQKLSLINPSKSAYFAAKIENLKTT